MEKLLWGRGTVKESTVLTDHAKAGVLGEATVEGGSGANVGDDHSVVGRQEHTSYLSFVVRQRILRPLKIVRQKSA